MEKTKLIQSLKVLIFGTIICFGFSFVFAGVNTPSIEAPDSNIPGPLNVGPIEQSKGGKAVEGSLLDINGTLSSAGLAVWGNAIFTNSFSADSFASSAGKMICVDSEGKLKTEENCNVPLPEMINLTADNLNPNVGSNTRLSWTALDPNNLKKGTENQCNLFKTKDGQTSILPPNADSTIFNFKSPFGTPNFYNLIPEQNGMVSGTYTIHIECARGEILLPNGKTQMATSNYVTLVVAPKR